MTRTFLVLICMATYILIGCGDNKSASNEKQETVAEEPGNKKSASTATAQQDELAGEWELVGSVVDTNDNLLIDEEERNKIKQASYKDYMKLNSDGTGLFTSGQMEGRYEIEKDEKTGRRFMNWYDKADGRHRVGSIMSVTKNELVIKEPGGSGLFLWKRI